MPHKPNDLKGGHVAIFARYGNSTFHKACREVDEKVLCAQYAAQFPPICKFLLE